MADDNAKTPSEGTLAQQRDAGDPEGERRPPVGGQGAGAHSVQYGSEQAVRAGVGVGRDEEPHTADGDVAPEKSGRDATGAQDRFVSSEAASRASERGQGNRKTTS